ncbi:MAG: RNA polymerase sigma factor [Candidatus Krumholzibacteriota bacterium]|nr:RNA polymerase sigma factor [Candidatus Krumholzibacteriota bacterium]
MRARLENITDEDLARLIAADRPEKACEELFGRYNKKIYMWCFSYTHDAEEALDCAQEILMRVFAKIDSFSFRSSLSTWIYRITRNYCLGEIASNRRKWYNRMLVLDELTDFVQGGDEPGKRLEISDDIEWFVEKAEGVISDDEMEAFILHYYEGMRIREISSIMRRENLTGARTLIQNARRKFRKLISKG